MKDYFKFKTWLITILMFIVAVGFSSVLVYFEFGSKENIKNISAQNIAYNVSGWAWNSNIGWISFNCDHTTDGTLPPTNTCGDANYGVNINTNKKFSGHAWSSNVGWISFNRSDAGDPPGDTTGDDIAKLDNNGNATGWAKILSMGDRGWIKLSGGWPNGVTIGATGAALTAENMTAPNWDYIEASTDALRANLQFGSVNSFGTGDFSGYAWNANDDGSGIGWISFSGDNYKAITTAEGSSGSSFTNYRIVVNDVNDPDDNSPTFDSGECTSSITPLCRLGVGIQFPLGDDGVIGVADGLKYGTPYYWWVKVWSGNGNGNNVAWTQYNTSSDTDNNDNINGADNKTFTTYKHEFPNIIESHFIENPSRKEEVKFIASDSKRFFSASPTIAINCYDNIEGDDPSDTCGWLWTTANNQDIIKNPNASTTIIIFNNAGDNTVTLKLTDKGDTGVTPYYSTKDIIFNVNAKLPGWKEVKPK